MVCERMVKTMAEYIDREEAKAWITAWLKEDKYWHPYSKGKNIPTTEVFATLSLIPAADVQPVSWIPVTEQLPESYTWVLVSAEGHNVAFDAFYDGAQWKDAVLNGLIVTHWMPLPELPKEE